MRFDYQPNIHCTWVWKKSCSAASSSYPRRLPSFKNVDRDNFTIGGHFHSSMYREQRKGCRSFLVRRALYLSCVRNTARRNVLATITLIKGCELFSWLLVYASIYASINDLAKSTFVPLFSMYFSSRLTLLAKRTFPQTERIFCQRTYAVRE